MFHGIGTLVNVVAIVVGGFVGLLLKKRITKTVQDDLNGAVGVGILLVGLTGVLTACLQVGEDGALSSRDMLLLIVSLALGTLIGSLLKLQERLDTLGDNLSQRFAKGEGDTFGQGLINASLIFCVGAMAIVGSIEDGMSGNPQTLFLKALLDGITAAILASSLGVGVLLSAIPVGIYQGSITLVAYLLSNASFVSDTLIMQLSLVGNALILCIGFTVSGVKKFKVASMLPAVLVPVFYALLSALI